MKKILSILFVVFAFSFTANAQTDKVKQEITINAKAKENLKELSRVIDFTNNESLFNGLNQLFINKHTAFSKEGITVREKQEISAQIAQKITASFSNEELNKIKQAPGLFERLIN